MEARTAAKIILPQNKKNRMRAIQKMSNPRQKHLAEYEEMEQEAKKKEKRSKRRSEEKGLKNYRLSAPYIYEHGNAPTSSPRSSSSLGRAATPKQGSPSKDARSK